jgi:ABC-2 type transport system ATP-binding protein
VTVIDHGQVVAAGTPDELKRLVPGGHIRLRFSGPDEAAGAARLLGGGAPAEDGLTVQVPYDGGVPALRAVLDRLGQQAVPVAGLSLRTPDLDDVFFALTGQPRAPQEDPR